MKKILLVVLIGLLPNFSFSQVAINPCARATDLHIVVIGSSTAAGSGPTNSANAWVNRYRNYLQSINSNNQVTNLAVGGTTTYHIMPDWFVSPIAGRPAVTPAKNVTQAISLGADAIIVNMPSNDASNGFGINEQMFNFITIKNSADSAGIPVWVCTTQPKTGLNAAKKAIQTGVRDSILNYFGSKAIDFWTGFADSTNGLLTFWDSGDGTHMNDTAHGVLNDRVIAEAIPNIVSDTLSYTDHTVHNIYLTNTSICGDSNSILNVVVTNLGTNSTVSESLQVQYQDNVLIANGTLGIASINQLGSCVSDTFQFTVNSFNGINQSYNAFINQSGDTDISNDSSNSITLYTIGHPSVTGTNDTVLSGANALLIASTATGDTIVWYDAISNGNIIGYGNQFGINNVTTNQMVYPEAVRGPLHYRNSLFTTANTATNWNGVMFNIIALSAITIDSLQIKVNSTGSQGVVAYNRLGSIVGNEMNASAWNSWGIDTVNATVAGEFKTIDIPDVNLLANDTLGVYLHMQSAGATLSYLNSAAAIYSNSEIQVQDGTGSAYTFGTTYSPRNWSGEVFYHYGFNPKGDCTSERIGVSALILIPDLNVDIKRIGLQIVPNPTNGILSFIGEKVPSRVEVINIEGKVIKDLAISNQQLNLSELHTGIYMLSFEIEGKQFVQKIMLR